MDFVFNQTQSRRPNSAELDAIIEETKRFYTDKLSALSGDFVEMSVRTSNLDLPLQIERSFRFRFFAYFGIKQASPWYAKDIHEMIDGFDYQIDYRMNYVWKATPMEPAEKNVFFHTISVTFKRESGKKKFNTFRNFETEGSYFAPGQRPGSPLREDTHVYNQKLWQQKVRNGGY